jgi:hypothetical protein
MIRDECPGTAAALREACDEHIGAALSQYDYLSNEEKQQLHDEKMAELEEDLVRIKENLERCLEKYKYCKETWKNYQKNPQKVRVA